MTEPGRAIGPPDALGRIPLFQTLSREDQEALGALLRPRDVAASG